MKRSQNSVESGEQLRLFKKRRKDMSTEERVSVLQEKLYQKAKQDKSFKFYVLYDKMFLSYMLTEAWKQVKSNDGTAGIDGVTITEVEQRGIDSYLEELGEELRKQTYRPQAVKRVMIDKEGGTGQRPLGIPTVKDRIAQTVCTMILEPIFEADFKECSHGFRPERSTKDAIAAVKAHLKDGKTDILDADISKYFDTIPHEKLMKALKERIADPRLLKLIESWLKVPVFENGQFKGGKKNHMGTPQGGVISPLLSNIYLHLLDRFIVHPDNLFYKYGVEIVRYADDFVLMGKKIPEVAIGKLQHLLSRMGLTLNGTKTRQIEARERSFDFLGFTIRYDKDLFVANKRYWNIEASAKSEKKIRHKVSDYLKTHGHSPAKDLVSGLNSRVIGWLNNFEVKGVSYPAMNRRMLRHHLMHSLNRYFKRKSQRKCRLYGQNAFEVLVQKFGLVDPTKYTSSAT